MQRPSGACSSRPPYSTSTAPPTSATCSLSCWLTPSPAGAACAAMTYISLQGLTNMGSMCSFNALLPFGVVTRLILRFTGSAVSRGAGSACHRPLQHKQQEILRIAPHFRCFVQRLRAYDRSTAPGDGRGDVARNGGERAHQPAEVLWVVCAS